MGTCAGAGFGAATSVRVEAAIGAAGCGLAAGADGFGTVVAATAAFRRRSC